MMNYKRLIALLTIATTCISFYYLNFTFVSRRIDKEATLYATTDGKVDFEKKQAYLAEKWNEVVYTMPLTKKEFTYKEISANTIALGLDLEPGMHITLKIHAPSVVKELAGIHGDDSSFKRIIKVAEEAYRKNPSVDFVKHFYKTYQTLMPNRPLHTIFFNKVTEHVVKVDEDDSIILDFINKHIVRETERTKKIYEKRLNEHGMGSLVIRLSPIVGVIEVEIQGITSTKRITNLLESTAQLVFYDIEMDTTKVSEVYKSALQGKHIEDSQGQMRPMEEVIKIGQGVFLCKAEDITAVRKKLSSEEIAEGLPIGYQIISEADPSNEGHYIIYVIKTGRDGRGLLSGDVIKKAYHTFNEGKCQVVMEMNGEGAKKWHQITREHINRPVAIGMSGMRKDEGVFDLILSAPRVDQPIPSGISRISGNFTIEQSKDLAGMLQSGALPALFEITGKSITGPTIGEAAQAQAFWVFVIALLLIILFMMFYYGGGGLVANIALLFNMLFILGTLAQLNAALSLAGIAGILLTFGMSVDANVLIFERIREELGRGVYSKEAVRQGFSRAISSILDGNFTTLFTGIILYALGQGPIKGFATTLIIGIISSLFTAVFVTRLIIEVIGPHRLNFGFSFTNNLFKNLNINFFGIRKFVYLFLFALIMTGMFCIKKYKLVKGVGFTGGDSFLVKLDTAPDALEGIRNQLSEDFEGSSVEVKTYGSSNQIKITTSYQGSSEEGVETTEDILIKGIHKVTGKEYIADPSKDMPLNSFAIVSSTKVGAAIADYVMMMAIYAILLALLMIFGYILIRFRRWQFGLAAVIALTHDTLMIFAALGIARAFGITYEIDEVFVGAVLTVIGYSINDTVVVFDRFRENLRSKHRYSFKEVANASINETISRTMITSLTTLLAVLTIYLFGGEALKGFSFTLMIGIIFGTISSIFSLTLSYDLATLFTRKK